MDKHYARAKAWREAEELKFALALGQKIFEMADKQGVEPESLATNDRMVAAVKAYEAYHQKQFDAEVAKAKAKD